MLSDLVNTHAEGPPTLPAPSSSLICVQDWKSFLHLFCGSGGPFLGYPLTRELVRHYRPAVKMRMSVRNAESVLIGQRGIQG